MNSKGKGEVSEAMVLAQLLKAGHAVSIPFGNNQRYDLVLDEGNGELLRVQVKTGRLRDGCVVFNTHSTNGFTGEKADYRNQIDLFMVYCPDLNTVYRVPVNQCPIRGMTLRIEPTRGGPLTTINWAKDYLIA